MQRWFIALTAPLLFLLLGCGGDTGKGINADKDKPKPVQNDS